MVQTAQRMTTKIFGGQTVRNEMLFFATESEEATAAFAGVSRVIA